MAPAVFVDTAERFANLPLQTSVFATAVHSFEHGSNEGRVRADHARVAIEARRVRDCLGDQNRHFCEQVISLSVGQRLTCEKREIVSSMSVRIRSTEWLSTQRTMEP